jgi:hypothetical protein
MAIAFSGCRNVEITQVDPLRGYPDAPAAVQFLIHGEGGRVQGEGPHPGTQLGYSVHVDGPSWTLAIQYLDRAGNWIDFPLRVTNTPAGTEVRAVGPGDTDPGSDDLILFCGLCYRVPPSPHGPKLTNLLINPDVLLLSDGVFVRINLPDPEPREAIRVRVAAIVSAMTTADRAAARARLASLRAYLDLAETELGK